ncbi:MAG: sulfotransferase [Thermodesulfobacteriota bacterium]|nr:sulfotransferase [Thermodesulfobacteriota bacterium]
MFNDPCELHSIPPERKLPVRRPAFKRNTHLEALLRELAGLLEPAEAEAVPEDGQPMLPVVFVVGAPRSGTTLVLQWLAKLGTFAYPTNLLSRFFASPYIGARIQQLLTDPRYQHGNEFSGLAGQGEEYASNLGKTTGILQPNEFWYFWRRFIPNNQPRVLTPKEEDSVDRDGFLRGLAAFEKAFGKPFALKGIILQYNLRCLAEFIPTAFFLYTKRTLLYNAQSLYQARIKYYGTPSAWYSVQPPGTDELRRRSPYEQVAGQVEYTNRSIEAELAALPPRCSLTVEYEEFCNAPFRVYEQIRERLGHFGFELPVVCHGPSSFQSTNSYQLQQQDMERLATACANIRSADAPVTRQQSGT